VTQDRSNFSGFVGLCRQTVDTLVVVVGVHRRLSANEEDRLVVADLELTNRFRILDQLRVFGRGEESERYQVVCGILALLPRIATVVGLEFAASRAEDIDLVAVLRKSPGGMGQLAPPEPKRPTGLLRHGGIRGHNSYTLGPLRVEYVNRFAHRIFLLCKVG